MRYKERIEPELEDINALKLFYFYNVPMLCLGPIIIFDTELYYYKELNNEI